MEWLGITIACVGVACGGAAPYLLGRSASSWRHWVAGNSALAMGALCNVAATKFAPQSTVQPLAGAMILVTVAVDTCTEPKVPGVSRSWRFWAGIAAIVLGDVSIIHGAPPMRAVDPDDGNVLDMILVGTAVTAMMLLVDLDRVRHFHAYWIVHGLRPGFVSGFALTSMNAFIAAASRGGADAHRPHQFLWLYLFFALGLSGVQIVLLNIATREASALDFQSVYVSTIVFSGSVVGIVTFDEFEGDTSGLRLVWFAVAFVCVACGAFVVTREDAAYKKRVVAAASAPAEPPTQTV